MSQSKDGTNYDKAHPILNGTIYMNNNIFHGPVYNNCHFASCNVGSIRSASSKFDDETLGSMNIHRSSPTSKSVDASHASSDRRESDVTNSAYKAMEQRLSAMEAKQVELQHQQQQQMLSSSKKVRQVKSRVTKNNEVVVTTTNNPREPEEKDKDKEDDDDDDNKEKRQRLV